MDEENEEREEGRAEKGDFEEIMRNLPREVRVFERGISPTTMDDYRVLSARLEKEQEAGTRERLSEAQMRLLLENDAVWLDTEQLHPVLAEAGNTATAEMFRFLRGLENRYLNGQDEWLYAAQMQCQMELENGLMDEPVGFIATPLGGRGSKIRYYFAVAAMEDLDEARRRLLVQDFEAVARRYNGDIDSVKSDGYLLLIEILLPYDKLIMDFIADCLNAALIELEDEYWVTNVVHPDMAELRAWLEGRRS